METEKAILGRRSVRHYEKKPVPEELIKKILKAGAMAPSAMDKQPCRFIVIEDRKMMGELASVVKEKAGALGFAAMLAESAKIMEDVIFYGAPLLILVVAEKDDWAPINCSLAAQSMMLTGYDNCLGSCFIGFMSMIDDDSPVLRKIGLKEKQHVYCPLIFGYPKSWPHGKSREPKTQNWIKG